MKVTQLTFTGTLPEVTGDGKGMKIDFGVLTLELNSIEVECLLMNIIAAYKDNPKIEEMLKKME